MASLEDLPQETLGNGLVETKMKGIFCKDIDLDEEDQYLKAMQNLNEKRRIQIDQEFSEDKVFEDMLTVAEGIEKQLSAEDQADLGQIMSMIKNQQDLLKAYKNQTKKEDLNLEKFNFTKEVALLKCVTFVRNENGEKFDQLSSINRIGKVGSQWVIKVAQAIDGVRNLGNLMNSTNDTEKASNSE